MAPGAGHGLLDQKHFERQMGCIGGLLNLFDRQQIVVRKRLPPPPPVVGSASPSERSDASSVSAAFVRESLNRSPPPDNNSPSTPSHPVPLLEAKNMARSSPKHRETLRLSLENRARGDDKGQIRPRAIRELASVASPSSQSDASEAAEESERQRRSPSVVARLMGLDALPDAAADGGGTESGRSELRWSASESRVPKYSSFSRLLDEGTFPKHLPVEPSPVSVDGFIRTPNISNFILPGVKKPKSPAKTSFLPPIQRKSFFEADDFFPDPKRRGLLPIELDKRHLMRGMDEAARDLETLKQILEALQLKGLLRSKPHDELVNGTREQSSQANSRFADYSPIVVIEPASSPFRRSWSEVRVPMPPKISVGRRTPAEETAIPHVRQIRRVDQNPASNNENKVQTPNLPAKRRTLNVPDSEKCTPSQRQISAASPPPNRICPNPSSGKTLLPNRRPKQEVASPKRRICSQAADNTEIAAATPPMDLEKSWAEHYRVGRQLLERCDRLLHSIEEFTAAEQVTVVPEPAAATAEQPSPISVLDSDILGKESSPLSPSSKRSLAFEGVQFTEHEEEAIASISEDSPDASEEMAVAMDDDDDYVYVAEILRASASYDDATELYTLLEKSRGTVPDAPKSAHLHRRLIFDAVAEILDQKRCILAPPWESFVRPGALSTSIRMSNTTPLLPEVLGELRRAQEHVSADDVDAVTCLAAGRDLAREDFVDSWARPAAEVADTAIQIERQIFKELIDGTIRDLADACVVVVVAVAAATSKPRPRRKLVHPRVP